MVIPLFLDLRNKEVVIFGGGKVGERRASLFARHAGKVTVISSDFTGGLKSLATKLDNLALIQESITPPLVEKYVENASIVVVATGDRGLNDAITQTARRHGKLVNNAGGGETDVLVPAIVKKGDVHLGITTGSPVVSRHLKEKISRAIEKEDLLLLELQGYARDLSKEHIPRQEDRARFLRRVFTDPSIRQLIKEDKVEEAKQKVFALVGGKK